MLCKDLSRGTCQKLMFAAALHPWLLAAALLLVPFAWYILRHATQRWNRWGLPDP